MKIVKFLVDYRITASPSNKYVSQLLFQKLKTTKWTYKIFKANKFLFIRASFCTYRVI